MTALRTPDDWSRREAVIRGRSCGEVIAGRRILRVAIFTRARDAGGRNPQTNLLEIARRARVGPATVERVLNGRGGVRPEMVERVIAAARALNYPKRLPEAHRGLLRIDVLLVRPETTFFSASPRRLTPRSPCIERSWMSTILLARALAAHQSQQASCAFPGDLRVYRFGVRGRSKLDGLHPCRVYGSTDRRMIPPVRRCSRL